MEQKSVSDGYSKRVGCRTWHGLGRGGAVEVYVCMYVCMERVKME